MGEKKSKLMFNIIAPIYALFYKSQKRNFSKIIEKTKKEFDITEFKTIIDIGCGTGALCSVLNEKGMKVTGVDSAKKMLKIAQKKPENKKINFVEANGLNKLPFEDNSFDIAVASYVAHGLTASERKILYSEMSRVAKHLVIFHDYNNKRGVFTSIIEYLEGGNYFEFIKYAKMEMEDAFKNLKIINVEAKANWYICKPKG